MNKTLTTLTCARNIVQAINFATSNPDKLKRREAFEDLAEALAEYTYIARVSEIAELIPESKRIDAFSDISKALAKAEDFDRATEFAKSIPDKLRMEEALSDISKVQTLAENAESAPIPVVETDTTKTTRFCTIL